MSQSLNLKLPVYVGEKIIGQVWQSALEKIRRDICKLVHCRTLTSQIQI